eukprot:TRINITY_DN49005_c0_g1_i1.p1 TRINITY_DN49005_c0_g1~~TRINITY_DN49005_c0_g1_i1.p1  ORF type:complete len:303 (+),score=11.80 TRINITY_DN49005_c0_g1_i1:68-976(+)
MMFAEPASFDVFSVSTWGYLLWCNLELLLKAVAFCMPLTFCLDRFTGRKARWKGGLFVSSMFYMAFSFLGFAKSYWASTADGSTWRPIECKVLATGIAGWTTTGWKDGPRGDTGSCSPEGFKGYTGITCDVHSQMEARHWLNASLPCVNPDLRNDMSFCRYSVWALVAVPGYLRSRDACAYDGFRAVKQDWTQYDESWQDVETLSEDWHTACMQREQLIGSTKTCWLNQRDGVLSLRDMPAVQDKLHVARSFGLYGSMIGIVVQFVLLWNDFWSMYCQCCCPSSIRVGPTFAREPLNPSSDV